MTWGHCGAIAVKKALCMIQVKVVKVSTKSLELMFVHYTRSDMKSAVGVHASSELGKPVL